jgi:hypothetical protein
VSHIDEGIFYFDPEGRFIMEIGMLFAGFFYKEKGGFFSSFPVSYNSDYISELEIIDTSFFSEFTNSCFFQRLSCFASSFREHDFSIFMADAEYFWCGTVFSDAYSSGTRIEPKERRDKSI